MNTYEEMKIRKEVNSILKMKWIIDNNSPDLSSPDNFKKMIEYANTRMEEIKEMVLRDFNKVDRSNEQYEQDYKTYTDLENDISLYLQLNDKNPVEITEDTTVEEAIGDNTNKITDIISELIESFKDDYAESGT